MSGNRLASVKFYLLRLLLSTLLLSYVTWSSRPAAAQVVKLGVPPLMNRQQALCQRTSGSCHYYRSCLESQFPCGNTGFILEYAKKRCEAVRKLDLSSSGCSTCINNEALYVWSHKVELCIRESLNSLIKNLKMPDPSKCQSFERSAVEKINACYGRGADSPKLCSILGEEIDEDEERDLQTLVSNFKIGSDYHNSTVDSGIPELVRECGHPDVADSLYSGQPTTRIILCTWGTLIPILHEPINRYIPDILSQNLNDDKSHFEYGGPDGTSACTLNIPSNAQNSDGSQAQFHIVTWFAPANHPIALNWSWSELATVINDIKGIFGYFELSLDRDDPAGSTIRDSTKCGDGIRQAAEVCDYAKINTPACSFNCEIQSINNSVYECSVERLVQSYCWVQVCGDGRRTSNEECDDGNLQNNDGCNSRCKVEQHYTCSSQYNATTVCRQQSPIVAAQHQSTRSQIVLVEHTEPPEVESFSLDSPLEINTAISLISRTELLISTTLLTLWTMLILA